MWNWPSVKILPGVGTAIVEEADESSMALTVTFLAGMVPAFSF
jgi:hypothetical protein